MYSLFNRKVNRSAAKTSTRRQSTNSLHFEKLEDRVVYSTSSVSLPAEISLVEGQSYRPVITRTGDLSQPLTLDYKFSAWADNHPDISRGSYTGTVTLKPGVKTFTLLPITAVDDKLDESDEYFYLDIAFAGGASSSLNAGRTVFTIKDNDAPPNVSITPLTSAKGENGGNVYFRVSLDAPSQKEVYVDFRGESFGTFKWGQDAFFENHPKDSQGSIYFRPGQTQKDIVVGVVDDKIVEATEFLQVSLTGGHGISGFSQAKAGVAIRDNDLPTVVVDDAGSIYEGNAAGATAKFKVRVLEAMERTVQVKYTTAPGEATSKSDYVGKSGTLTLGGDPRFGNVAPSQQTVSVALRADTIDEATAERFYLKVSPIDATAANQLNLQKPLGKATIVDDDTPPRTTVGTPAPISAIPTPENGWGGQVQLRWAAAANAARYEILLTKATNPFLTVKYYFTYPNFVETPITGTTFQTGLLEPGAWLWQVRAVAADGNIGMWSSQQRFEIT